MSGLTCSVSFRVTWERSEDQVQGVTCLFLWVPVPSRTVPEGFGLGWLVSRVTTGWYLFVLFMYSNQTWRSVSSPPGDQDFRGFPYPFTWDSGSRVRRGGPRVRRDRQGSTTVRTRLEPTNVHDKGEELVGRESIRGPREWVKEVHGRI